VKPHERPNPLRGAVPFCKSCNKRPQLSKPERCPLHGVIPPIGSDDPNEGDGLCRCCRSCRDKCYQEV